MIGLTVAGVLVLLWSVRPGHGSAVQSRKTVVIDPGHGGRETGAIGPGGTTEKGVTLTLAQQIREELGDRYRTILTRSDDYRMDVFARTATANHQKADLFISLHTGGGYDASLDGITILIYGGVGVQTIVSDSLDQSPAGLVEWELGHLRHIPESRRLAGILRRALSKRFPSKAVSGVEAPIAVLAGADMPAAVIEIGYLTHPATELYLKEPGRMVELTKAIAGGIDAFFMK